MKFSIAIILYQMVIFISQSLACRDVKAQAAHDIFVEMQLKILHCIVKFYLVISLNLFKFLLQLNMVKGTIEYLKLSKRTFSNHFKWNESGGQ